MPSIHKKTKKSVGSLRGFVVIILIGVAIFAGKMVISSFSVKNIECQLDQQTCPESLTNSLTVLHGKPLFFTNYQSILQEQRVPLPVTLTQVKKHLPNTLNLEFSSQNLAYMIQTNEGTIAVSTTGVLFKDTTVLPPTTIEVKPELSSVLDPNHAIQAPIHTAFLELVTTLEKSDLPVKHISWVDKDTINLIMNDGQLNAVVDQKNPRVAIEKLELIIKSQEYQAVQENVQEIDLRFDLPVLRMRQ